MRPPTATLLLLALLLALPLAPAQPLHVSAASSLTEAFEAIAARFEATHPGVRVLLNFAGSATLAQQILQGAPVEVFASADEAQLRVVAAMGRLDGVGERFARAPLAVIVPAGGRVQTLADLATPGVRLVLAGPEVPAGAYARAAIGELGAKFGAAYPAAVLANLVSEEPNVRQAAAKVTLGEADAAIVYATDAAILRGVTTLGLDAAVDVRASFTAAVVRGSRQQALADTFLAFLLGPEGQAILAAHGFLAP
jgi:molybdate transport system substrate-binding protein